MTACESIRRYVQNRRKESDEEFIHRILTEVDKVVNLEEYESLERIRHKNYKGIYVPFSKKDYVRIVQLVDEINRASENYLFVVEASKDKYVHLILRKRMNSK